MAYTVFIDLSKEHIVKRETDTGDLRLFLGSRGYAAKLLYDHVGPDIAPFDPGNMLIFSVGPFTGTNWPTGARMTVSAKSPATDAYGYGNAGGHIGAELRKAGYDAVVITGKASRPSYVHIEDGAIEILPAFEFWGLAATETEERLKGRHEKHEVGCIGPGGENKVYFAGVMTDGGRTAGRTGMGAVMGSKNLKALVVRGSNRVQVPPEFKKLATDKAKKLLQNSAAKDYRRWGTSILMNYKNPRGDIPTRNYQESQAPVIRKVNAQALDEYVDKTNGCFSCPIRCGRHTRIESGPYAMESEGPEYETVNSFGPLVGNDNMEVVLYANYLCNRYGIDTISTGLLIAFAMECHQHGILNDPEFNLEWGDADTIVGLVEKIGRREGLGNILADGVKRAAEQIHPEAERYAMHVKGLETPRQEPRTNRGLALGHVTSARGADHLYGLSTIDQTKNKEAAERYFPGAGEEILDVFSQKYKPQVLKFTEAFAAVSDALGICKFSTLEAYALGPEDIAEGMSACFGRTVTMEELLQAGERIVNLERMYNIRHGMDRKDDMLKDRFLKEPMTVYVEKEGELTEEVWKEGLLVELDSMLDEYYKERGWTNRGIPTEDKLRELELDFLVRDLPARVKAGSGRES
jgi:aldehyde:ferredoxin oxidoreductase